MKNILYIFLLINTLLIVFSCSTSNELSSHSRIQKKRYSNGFYISSFRNTKNTEILTEDLNVDKNNDLLQIPSEDILSNSIQASNSNDIYSDVIFPNKNKNNIELNQINTVDQPIKNNAEKIKKEEKLSIKNSNNQEIRINKKKLNSFVKSQKSKSKSDENLLFILLLVLAFILPPLSVLLFTNIDWKKVLIATLLTCFFWGPGVIYAILVLLEIL